MATFPLSLSQWKYRKAFQITEQAGQNLTDYQKLIKIGESSGATEADFHLEGLSAIFPSEKNQSGDLRITDSDKTTLLNFWVEQVTGTSPNRIAYVWVKIPSLSANQTKTLYCYFGNPTATNASNGDNTFLFFDDFPTATLNTTKWNILANGTPVTSPVWEGSYSVKANNTGVNNNNLKSNYNLSNIGMSIDFMFYDNGFTSTATNMWGGFLDTTGAANVVGVVDGSYTRYSYNYDGTSSSIGVSRSVGWHFGSIKRTSSQVIFTVDNTTVTINYTNTFSYLTFYSIQGTGWWDVIRVRKYVSPEPAFSSAGSLEKRSSIIPLII
jgi:hypothetical protein